MAEGTSSVRLFFPKENIFPKKEFQDASAESGKTTSNITITDTAHPKLFFEIKTGFFEVSGRGFIYRTPFLSL
jgi:hypothetical protein